jgi:tripartite-type tricarboxylate transporter receptor subunit TctC
MKRSLSLVLALTAACLAWSPAGAQTYPAKPIKIIVPIGPGGSYDFVGRQIAQKLTERIGQNVYVENRTGAGTLVGTQAAAAAPADGYTLLVGGLSNMAFNAALYQNANYDALRDFVPVALVYGFPYILVARKDFPQSNLKEILETAKSRPDGVTMASAGVGTGQHIIAAAMMKMANVKMLEVPYKGAQLAYTDILAGRVDMFFDSASAALPHIVSGGVKGIAVASPHRIAAAADVPTMAEAGLPELGIDSWIGIYAPAKTPPEVIERLRRDVRAVVPSLKEAFEKSGGSIIEMPVEQTDSFVKAEFDKWTKVIRDAGIRLD